MPKTPSRMPKTQYKRYASGAVKTSKTVSSASKPRGGSGRAAAATRLQALFRGRKVRQSAKRKYKKYGVKGKMSKKATLAKGRISRNRARALELLAKKAAEKAVKKSALSVVNKKKLATIPGVVTQHLYRKYCTMNPDAATLWNSADGQLVIDVNVPGKPYEDRISHKPFYHFEGYKGECLPGQFKRYIHIAAVDNDPAAVDIEDKATKQFMNPLAGKGVNILSIEPDQQPPGTSGSGAQDLIAAKDMFVYDNGMDPHQNIVRHFGYNEFKVDILPKVFHEDQLKYVIQQDNTKKLVGGVMTDRTATDPLRYQDEWARCLPSRSTDSIKIKNFYIKFDFDTKFYGDEGTRENVIQAIGTDYMDYNDQRYYGNLVSGTGNSGAGNVIRNPRVGARTQVTLNNRVPNMYAKVRIIIGQRKTFGKTASERVCLHNVLKTDNDKMYERHVSDEEYLSDLFSRQNIRRRTQNGITHRTMDEDEYDDIKILKDEVVTLGRGHSVKTINCMKNLVMNYPETEDKTNFIEGINLAGDSNANQATLNFTKLGHVEFTEAQINSDLLEDKLTIPLEGDMFMYVLNFTKGAAVRWRLTTKLSYHSC